MCGAPSLGQSGADQLEAPPLIFFFDSKTTLY
jgi:hypothetical protein